MTRKQKRELAICLFTCAMLALINYQTNQFSHMWFIYPSLFWAGYLIINILFGEDNEPEVEKKEK